MTYEYKIFSDSYSADSEAELNKLGADGWQLITNWQLGSLVFMRAVKESDTKYQGCNCTVLATPDSIRAEMQRLHDMIEVVKAGDSNESGKPKPTGITIVGSPEFQPPIAEMIAGLTKEKRKYNNKK